MSHRGTGHGMPSTYGIEWATDGHSRKRFDENFDKINWKDGSGGVHTILVKNKNGTKLVRDVARCKICRHWLPPEKKYGRSGRAFPDIPSISCPKAQHDDYELGTIYPPPNFWCESFELGAK